MGELLRFRSGHESFLHDAAFDWFGSRLATCSADRSIKVWTDESGRGDWVLQSTLPDAHTAPINRICWSHPEFGEVIASCSNDLNVHVFEEVSTKSGSKVVKKWVKRAALVDSKDEVSGCQFAPRNLGLKLATCSKDGVVRIYEAVDIAKLSIWPLQQEFVADTKKHCCLSLSWNPSPFDPPQIAVGTASGASIWQLSDQLNSWNCILEIPLEENIEFSVLDIQWAPNIGRPYHFIACACESQKLFICKIKFPKNSSDPIECKVSSLTIEGNPQIWRVSWNVTGTMMASSGDDGKVRIWKMDFSGQWRVFKTYDSGDTLPSDRVREDLHHSSEPIPASIK